MPRLEIFDSSFSTRSGALDLTIHQINNYDTNKNLISFFAFTLFWTWSCGFIPVFLHINGTPLGNCIFYFGGGAPSVVGLCFVLFTYPKGAKRDFFGRCFSFNKLGWKCTIWIIVFFTAITNIGLLIGINVFNLEMPGMDYIHIVIKDPYMMFLVLLITVVSGPLNEEFGWRGYALDKLLVRFGFVGSSALLGFIWGVWHFAWYFTPGQAQYNLLQNSVIDALMFIPSIILLSFVVTFVYIKTNRSVLAGALVHMLGNLISSQLLSPYSADIGMVIRYVKMVFCLVVVIYTLTSRKFKSEVQKQIAQIKSDEKEFIAQAYRHVENIEELQK